jgi:hypothetical protein
VLLGGLLGPRVASLAGHLPVLEVEAALVVDGMPQRLQDFLELLPDDVDLGVVRDRLQGDVRDPLVDEAMADVAVGRGRRRCRARDLGLLELALVGVREEVIGVARAHDAYAGQGERHAGRVDRDPAAAPLLGDVGGGAGAAGGVEDEVAGVGGH